MLKYLFMRMCRNDNFVTIMKKAPNNSMPFVNLLTNQ